MKAIETTAGIGAMLSGAGSLAALGYGAVASAAEAGIFGEAATEIAGYFGASSLAGTTEAADAAVLKAAQASEKAGEMEIQFLPMTSLEKEAAASGLDGVFTPEALQGAGVTGASGVDQELMDAAWEKSAIRQAKYAPGGPVNRYKLTIPKSKPLAGKRGRVVGKAVKRIVKRKRLL
jgi:hypothetical protein